MAARTGRKIVRAEMAVQAQYVFLDVVGFTRDRSVEDQSAIVEKLNQIVTEALTLLPGQQFILVPTGDGVLIAIVRPREYDSHMRLALRILMLLNIHNRLEHSPRRQFEVRIGINENKDNIVLDVNGRRNVAGAGVSLAQRVMNLADGSQVLVGQAVYDVLNPREAYFAKFRGYVGPGKHGVQMPVHQFVSKAAVGLSTAEPSAFARAEVPKPRLSKFAAFYFGHAIRNRAFLEGRKEDPWRDYAAVVLLTLLAQDSETEATTARHQNPVRRAWQAGSGKSFADQYTYYHGLDYIVLSELAELLAEKNLERYSEFFAGDMYDKCYWLVNKDGVQKLLDDAHEIAKRFDLAPKAETSAAIARRKQ